MIVKRNKEKGALAIDAILGIVMFIFTVLGIMFLALMIRVQANMQYALSQTAKEISGYFYFLDKVGLTSTISGSYEDIAADVNQNIGLVVEFAGGISDTVEDVSDATSVEEIMDILNSNSEDLSSQLSEIEAMLSDYTKDDVAKQMKAVLQIFGRTMINKAFGEIVAPLACKVLMPKYLTRGNINEYYESMGIDPDKVKFSGSEMLKDGRSIKLVCSYELDLSKYTFGLVHKTMKFQQIAATAAWVKPNDTQSIRRIQDILEAPSAPPETSSTPSSDTPTDVTTTEASTSDSVTTTTVPTLSDNSTTSTTPVIIVFWYDTTTSTTLSNITSTSTTTTTMPMRDLTTYRWNDGPLVDAQYLGKGDVGNFENLQGLTVPEILERIPSNATRRDLTPVAGKVTEGFEYSWNDGTATYRVRIHGSDPSAPAGSNAASGWVVRVQKGGKYLDPLTNEYKPRGMTNVNSPNYDADAANRSHIPIVTPEG